MDKRVFIAAGVSVLVLIGWSYLFPPPPPPQLPPAPAPLVETAAAPAPEAAPPGEAAPEIEPARAAAVASEISIVSEPFKLILTNRGGIALSWELSDESTSHRPLELLPQVGAGQARTLGLNLDDASLAETLNEALYQVERWPGERGERIDLVWANGLGLEARKTLTFQRGSYVVGVEVEVRDRGRRLPVRLALGPGFGEQGLEPKNGMATYYYEAVVWNQAGQVTHRKKSKTEEPGGLAGGVRWAGLEDQYFAALVVPDGLNGDLRWRAVDLVPATAAGKTVSFPIAAVAVPETGARLFVGPKKYELLESLGAELEQAIWFSSWPALTWIAQRIFFVLVWVHDHTVPNYGLAIVLTTFLLRLVLFPVNQYSMVAMKKTQLQMQRLQPKIKNIKSKYKKKDAETRGKMNQEMMDLYKREGINPLGGVTGCLPLIAQIPILMSFYFMLTVAVELRSAPFFGWIKDLSVSDPYWVTPLLMGATMFVQQKMAMTKVKDPQQQQQQKIMLIMPFIFTYICLQMPAGMVLYWFVNNVLGIGQQWLVNRHTTRLEAAEQGA